MWLVEGAEDGSEEMASGGENRYFCGKVQCGAVFSPEKLFEAIVNVLKFFARGRQHTES